MTEIKHKVITNDKPKIENMTKEEEQVFFLALLHEIVKHHSETKNVPVTQSTIQVTLKNDRL